MESTLVAGGGGIFDVTVDGKLVFSKHEVGDFPNEDALLKRIEGETRG